MEDRREACKHCYYGYKLNNCFKCFFSDFCSDSANCYFCSDCKNCKNCIWCVGLNNKEYYVYNKKVSKEEFQKIKEDLNKWNYKIYKQLEANFLNLKLSKIHRNVKKINSNNCTWDWLLNCDNSKEIYDCFEIQDSKYSLNCSWKNINDCYNAWFTWELLYNSLASYNVYGILFSCSVFDSKNIIYSINCFWNCSNLFWCTWLRNKQYCILNKQYTKEEYNKLVPKIIEKMKSRIGGREWWEFFPASLSPFWYNETVAQEYFPLEKEQSLKKWFNWSDYEAPLPKVDKIIQANKLPKNISDIPDDILNWAIECEITKKPFKIIKQELEFYRKHNLPIPKTHPEQRHLDRMKLRNPRKLFDRDCYKCWVNMKTTFSPDREEKVYCQKCYNNKIY